MPKARTPETKLARELSGLDPEKAKLQAEEALCRLDRTYWITRHFKIKDRDSGQILPFHPLRPTQQKLLALIKWARDQNQPVRIIILKARKTGISTLTEADLFCEVLSRGIDAIVIAHDMDTAEYIFEITHRLYENYDLEKPELARANRREMKFARREGFVRIETANNVQAGTGMTPQFLHVSEPSKYERGSETATALFQSIGTGPGTTVIIESTAYGYDDLFYPMWQDAERNCRITWDQDEAGDWKPHVEVVNQDAWNGYLPYFIAWYDEPTYVKEFASQDDRKRFEGVLDDTEMDLHTQGVSLEAMNWRRWAIKERCQNKLPLFKQEYPSNSAECFLTTGRPRLDHETLDSMPLEDGRIGMLVREQAWDRHIKFVPAKNEPLTIFRNPQRGHRYSIGVDIAEGILVEGTGKADQSVACVLDIDNGGEQAAVLAGHISEEAIVAPLALLAEYYNMAYVVVESNSTGKHTIIEMAKVYPVDRLYHRTDWDEGKARRGRILGWRTHVGSRPILIGKLAQSIAEKAVILHHRDTVLECKRLSYMSGGRVEADKGAHDDTVFALGMAIIGMLYYPFEDRELAERSIGSIQAEIDRRRQSSQTYLADADPDVGY